MRSLHSQLYLAQIHAIYSLTSPASNLQPRFNICPTDTVGLATPGMGAADRDARDRVPQQRIV